MYRVVQDFYHHGNLSEYQGNMFVARIKGLQERAEAKAQHDLDPA